MSEIERAALAILSVLPAHRFELSITHNAHRNFYEPLADYAEEIDWVSDEERLLAVKLDEVWEAQWYPNTPIGFCRIGASSLPALLAALQEAAA